MSEWQKRTLNELGDFMSGGGFPIIYQGETSGDYPFYKVSDLNNIGNESCLDRSNNYIHEDVRRKLRLKLIPQNSIVFAKIGAAVYLERKRIMIHNGLIDNNMAAFIGNGTTIEKLMYYIFQLIRIGNYTNTTALPAVDLRGLGHHEAYYPVDPKEQSRIAAVLTAADEAIAASRALVEKYAAVKQGLMQDLLSGRVRLAGFTGDWEQLKIGNLLDFKNGLNKGKEFFGTGIPIVNYMDVYTKSSIRAASLEGRVNLSKNEIKRFEVKKGDVFFTRTSETVNEVGYASVLLDDVEDGVFSGFVLRGRPKNDKLDIYYCQYCFSTQEIRRAIIVGATCTTRALTSGTYLSTIPILLPKPDEQRAIAEVIMAADERLTAERERLMKLEDIKRGLMDDLLTNRVSTDKLQGGI